MTDYADLEKRLREMASAWKRWGADGIYMGALQSDIVTEAANVISALRREREEALSVDALAASITAAAQQTSAGSRGFWHGLSHAREIANIMVRNRLSSDLRDENGSKG